MAFSLELDHLMFGTDQALPPNVHTFYFFIAALLTLSLYVSYVHFSPSPFPSKSIKDAFPTVLSVARSPDHSFTKLRTASITLVPGLGVQGDAHLGTTVQHRSRLHIRPSPPNFRQVHLIQSETLSSFSVPPAALGENITTTGIDLLSLGRGTKLRFISPSTANEDNWKPRNRKEGEGGEEEACEPPTITITGVRNPCAQIEKYRAGLQEKFIQRDEQRNIIARRAGVMSTVDVGGDIRPGMKILVEEPEKFEALDCV